MIGTFREYTNLILRRWLPFNVRADGSLPFSARTLSEADQSSHQHESPLIRRTTAEAFPWTRPDDASSVTIFSLKSA